MQNLDVINALINSFTKLPGVGYKTAERYAYRIIEMNKDDVKKFTAAIENVKNSVKLCSVCGNFATNEKCKICENRGGDIICVVSHPKDIITIEKANAFNGRYHVLHGVISPLDRKGPEHLNIKSLFTRLQTEKINEVILALSPDVEGEATANYLASLIKPCRITSGSGGGGADCIKVSRLATGISMGSSLDYADEMTITTAIKNRIAL
jgi:recombination protein RecR